MLEALALVVPIGLSPFLALAALGVAQALFGYTPPPGLAGFLHPALTALWFVLATLLGTGRSAKLSKPFAELLGGLESATGLVVLGVTLHAALQLAGVSAALALVPLLLSAAVVMLLRTALDVASWLTPIPLLDLLVQGAKSLLVLGLVALAAVAPSAALVVDLLLFLGGLAALGFALRSIRFAFSVIHDHTLGRLDGVPALPRDEVIAQDLGPFPVFAAQVKGVPRRTPGRLELRAGRWFAVFRRRFRGEVTVPLGDAVEARITSSLFGVELALPGGSVLLPPRYRAHLPALERSVEGRAVVEEPARPARAARPLAQPSTS